MSASALQYPNRQPTLHRPAPMREDFALRYEHVVFSPTRHQKNRGICSGTGYLCDVIVSLTGRIIKLNYSVELQIPIACSCP
jgi:hypothetical protein